MAGLSILNNWMIVLIVMFVLICGQESHWMSTVMEQNSIPSSDKTYTNNYNRIRQVNTLLQQAEGYLAPADIETSVGEAHFFSPLPGDKASHHEI